MVPYVSSKACDREQIEMEFVCLKSFVVRIDAWRDSRPSSKSLHRYCHVQASTFEVDEAHFRSNHSSSLAFALACAVSA